MAIRDHGAGDEDEEQRNSMRATGAMVLRNKNPSGRKGEDTIAVRCGGVGWNGLRDCLTLSMFMPETKKPPRAIGRQNSPSPRAQTKEFCTPTLSRKERNESNKEKARGAKDKVGDPLTRSGMRIPHHGNLQIRRRSTTEDIGIGGTHAFKRFKSGIVFNPILSGQEGYTGEMGNA